MRWDAFETACPQIAALANERFAGDEVVMLGTVRADGSARVSPCEVDVAVGRLLLGMMPGSRKARDLYRDPRIAVHSVPSGRMNPGGDVKVYGLAIDEQDPQVRAAYREALRARIDWAPEEPDYHLFSVDVREAAYMRFGQDAVALTWNPQDGLRDLHHPPTVD
jgi:hypothetical protein